MSGAPAPRPKRNAAKKASRYEEEITVKSYTRKNAKKWTIDTSVPKPGHKKEAASAPPPKKKRMTQAQKDVPCEEGNKHVCYTLN